MSTAVLLAVYNGEKYLPEMLDSLEGQTCQDFSIYVSDDGSKDRTLEIIEERRNISPGKYIILPPREKKGPPDGACGNFYRLLSEVEADTYFFADHDDFWFPEKIEREKELLDELREKHTDDVPLTVFSDAVICDGDLNETAPSLIGMLGRDPAMTAYTELIIDNVAAGCTMCFNRRLRDMAISPVPDVLKIEMHDEYLMLLSSIFGQIGYVGGPLLKYRIHGGNEMGASKEGVVGKVFRNASDIFSGRYRAEKKAFMEKKYDTARELLKRGDLPDDIRQILERFAAPGTESRSGRVRFLKANGFRRNKNNAWFYQYA